LFCSPLEQLSIISLSEPEQSRKNFLSIMIDDLITETSSARLIDA
jgi:hypothetical protein